MTGILRKVAVKARILERTMVVVITVLMIGLFGFNVLVREITPQFASTFAWIDEASRILMVWGVFLTLGLALERGRHIAMSSLLVVLPGNVRFYIRKSIDLTGVFFALYCAWLGYRMAVFVFSTGQVSPTLNLPMYILYIGPMIGFILLALRYFLDLFGLTDRGGFENSSADDPAAAG